MALSGAKHKPTTDPETNLVASLYSAALDDIRTSLDIETEDSPTAIMSQHLFTIKEISIGRKLTTSETFASSFFAGIHELSKTLTLEKMHGLENPETWQSEALLKTAIHTFVDVHFGKWGFDVEGIMSYPSIVDCIERTTTGIGEMKKPFNTATTTLDARASSTSPSPETTTHPT